MSEETTHYREVQPFHANPIVKPVLVVVLLTCGVPLWATGSGLGLNAPSLLLPVVLLTALLLVFGEMRTEVRSDGVYAQVFPLTRRHAFPWHELARFEAVTYRPLVEYGGWGVRHGRGGRAYNVSGNRGVQLELVDGRRILLGSKRPEELVAAMRERSTQL